MPTASETVLLEVDWDNDGLFAHAQSDITADILEIPDYHLGRDSLSTLYGRSTAGGMTVILDNSGNKYSKNNTGSVLTGLIKPARRVRLSSATNGGGAVVQWHGYLDDIIAQVRAGTAHEATLFALGPLSRIQARRAYVPPAADVLTSVGVTSVLDAVGFPAGDRSIDTGLTTMTRHFVEGDFGHDALAQLEETEAGFIRETRDAGIAFENRHHRVLPPHDTVQETYSDLDDGTTIFYEALEPDMQLKAIANIIRAKVRSQVVASIADLWTLHETGAASPALGAGQSITMVAEYPTPDAANGDIGVSVWEDPAATTDYTCNSLANGTGTDRTADLGISTVKGLRTMEITATNNGSGRLFITAMKARGTALQAQNETLVQHKDTASIASYGEREYLIPAEFIPNLTECNNYCQYIASLHGAEIPSFPLTYIANQSQAAMDDALAREVSDRVHLVADNATGEGIDDDMFVERIAHSIDRENVHRVNIELSKASESFALFIVLDTGPGLDTGILAY